jgi:hypothetical protein
MEDCNYKVIGVTKSKRGQVSPGLWTGLNHNATRYPPVAPLSGDGLRIKKRTGGRLKY